jgi:hypothetical protein
MPASQSGADVMENVKEVHRVLAQCVSDYDELVRLVCNRQPCEK